MTQPISFGTIPSTAAPVEPAKPEAPFRIAVLADYSGRQNCGIFGLSKDVAARRLLRVTRETIDEVMAKLNVQLHLPVGAAGDLIALPFASMEDFHPDSIHDRVTQISDAFDADEKSAMMNGILHHPDFQALESAWRGLYWLLGRASKGKAEVLLLDLSFEELWADVKTHDNLGMSALNHVLIEKSIRGPQGNPLAAIVGNYTFYLSAPYAEILGRLAKIAARANAPFLTTVDPQVADSAFALNAEDASVWQALRKVPESSHLGLSIPRFLLRPPWGEDTRSIDRFAYNEITIPPDRSHYLWGNSALACAALLSQGFLQGGWAHKPGPLLDVEDLALHVYTRDGEEEVVVAESWLLKPQLEQLVKRGIMAFQSVRDKAALQLLRFQSVAQPPQGQPGSELRGHWSDPNAVSAAPKAAAPAAPKVSLIATPSAPPPAMSLATLQPSAPAPAASAAPKPATAPAPASTPPPPAPEAAPAEEEMDPDLAELLKSLE